MDTSERTKELILEFSKLIDNPAMLAIRAKIEEMQGLIPREPAYYADNPNDAHRFAGYEEAIIQINNFIHNHMEYAIKDQAESGQDDHSSSTGEA